MMRGAVEDGLVSDRSAEDRFILAAGLAGAAVAVGDPDLALEAIDRILADAHDTEGLGATERIVANGLALLQVGRVAEAVALLRGPAEGSADVPAVGLCPERAGPRPGRQRRRRRGAGGGRRRPEGDRGTYLDRVMAEIACGLVAARRGDDDALAILNDTIEDADALEDEVAQTIARLAEAAALGGPRRPVGGRGRPRGRCPAGRAGHQRPGMAPDHRPGPGPQARIRLDRPAARAPARGRAAPQGRCCRTSMVGRDGGRSPGGPTAAGEPCGGRA